METIFTVLVSHDGCYMSAWVFFTFVNLIFMGSLCHILMIFAHYSVKSLTLMDVIWSTDIVYSVIILFCNEQVIELDVTYQLKGMTTPRIVFLSYFVN